MRATRPVLAAITALAACAIAACVARRGVPVGVSTGPGPAAPSVDGGVAAEAAAPSPIAEWRATMTKVNPSRFVSKGHAAGRWEVDVYANDAGRAALESASGEVTVGARFLVEHFEHDKPGPVMAMEKRPAGYDAEHGDWRYVVVGASGELVKDGVVESCAGCHGDAPKDHLFAVDR